MLWSDRKIPTTTIDCYRSLINDCVNNLNIVVVFQLSNYQSCLPVLTEEVLLQIPQVSNHSLGSSDSHHVWSLTAKAG